MTVFFLHISPMTELLRESNKLLGGPLTLKMSRNIVNLVTDVRKLIKLLVKDMDYYKKLKNLKKDGLLLIWTLFVRRGVAKNWYSSSCTRCKVKIKVDSAVKTQGMGFEMVKMEIIKQKQLFLS